MYDGIIENRAATAFAISHSAFVVYYIRLASADIPARQALPAAAAEHPHWT